jgi:hypothetical protein
VSQGPQKDNYCQEKVVTKDQENSIRECLQELETIKRRLTGLLANQPIETFTPPTKQEIWGHWLEKSYPRDEAKKFFDYYTSNGWKVGRNGMKDWKAAASQWIRRVEEREKHKRNSKSDRHDQATIAYLYGDQPLERGHG